MMALNNTIQWLLGLGIIVAGAFMLFGQPEEMPLDGEPAGQIAQENVPPPPADLPIKPVDAKTRACMADVACMQDFFLRVTLGNAYQPRNHDNPRINKWQMPIKFRIYGRDRLDKTRSDAIEQSLAEMSRIAGLIGVELGPSTRGINVLMLLTADLRFDLEGRFSELTDRAFRPIPGFVDDLINLQTLSLKCAALLFSELDGQASYVGGYIDPTLDPDWLKRCVYEEFSQMLGLYADVADDIDSLYTDQAHRRQLTEFDFLLLRLLYHPLIKPGMSRSDVIQVFPEVYDEVVTRPITD